MPVRVSSDTVRGRNTHIFIFSRGKGVFPFPKKEQPATPRRVSEAHGASPPLRAPPRAPSCRRGGPLLLRALLERRRVAEQAEGGKVDQNRRDTRRGVPERSLGLHARYDVRVSRDVQTTEDNVFFFFVLDFESEVDMRIHNVSSHHINTISTRTTQPLGSQALPPSLKRSRRPGEGAETY